LAVAVSCWLVTGWPGTVSSDVCLGWAGRKPCSAPLGWYGFLAVDPRPEFVHVIFQQLFLFSRQIAFFSSGNASCIKPVRFSNPRFLSAAGWGWSVLVRNVAAVAKQGSQGSTFSRRTRLQAACWRFPPLSSFVPLAPRGVGRAF